MWREKVETPLFREDMKDFEGKSTNFVTKDNRTNRQQVTTLKNQKQLKKEDMQELIVSPINTTSEENESIQAIAKNHREIKEKEKIVNSTRLFIKTFVGGNIIIYILFFYSYSESISSCQLYFINL